MSVDSGVPVRGGVGEVDGGLSVLDAPGSADALPPQAGNAGVFLRVAGPGRTFPDEPHLSRIQLAREETRGNGRSHGSERNRPQYRSASRTSVSGAGRGRRRKGQALPEYPV